MVSPSYKENERLISGEGEKEEKIRGKTADIESTAAGNWPLKDLSQALVGQQVTSELLR